MRKDDSAPRSAKQTITRAPASGDSGIVNFATGPPALKIYYAQPHFCSAANAGNIDYEVVPHPPTMASISTAQACGVPPERVAKGIVVRTGDRYVLAVLNGAVEERTPAASLEGLGMVAKVEIVERLGERTG